jgi:acid phosphatase type 7
MNHRPLLIAALLFSSAVIGCSTRGQSVPVSESPKSASLQTKIPSSFSFVAYGDTRFHDPTDTATSNPIARRALVAAIDREHPAFISIGGDIVYLGDSADWNTWDSETAIWREHKIAIYPALGNHDVKGDLQKALANYFARFSELQESRFYSMRTENTVMLVLDSNIDELSGAQGAWLRSELEQIPGTADFVFLVFHHPVYTSSSDEKAFGGGHSSRSGEEALGKLLEEKQQHLRARIVVFNGHVHNYERFEHGGISYFVSGGGGARAYPIARKPGDLYQDGGINYHYLLVQVDHNHVTVTMHKLELTDGKEVWTEPDKVSLSAPANALAAHQ